jgi:hypothetical protein
LEEPRQVAEGNFAHRLKVGADTQKMCLALYLGAVKNIVRVFIRCISVILVIIFYPEQGERHSGPHDFGQDDEFMRQYHLCRCAFRGRVTEGTQDGSAEI